MSNWYGDLGWLDGAGLRAMDDPAPWEPRVIRGGRGRSSGDGGSNPLRWPSGLLGGMIGTVSAAALIGIWLAWRGTWMHRMLARGAQLDGGALFWRWLSQPEQWLVGAVFLAVVAGLVYYAAASTWKATKR